MRNDKKLKFDFQQKNNINNNQFLGRPSLNQATRRSSVFSLRKSKDPRDVRRDKEQNITVLSKFLSAYSFPDDVSARTLRAPATNYVKNVFLFIFNKFNSNFTDFSRFDDDVKILLQLYGFPFNLAKSYLQAPGTPNSWPYILSSIVWLIELFEKEKKLKNNKNKETDPLENINLTAKQYKNFLSGADMREVENKIEEFHMREKNKIENKIKEEELNLKEVENDIKRLNDKPKIAGREQRLRKLKIDIKNFEKLISVSKKHFELVVRETKKHENIEKRLKSKLKEISLQEEYAKYELEKQPVSREDVVQIHNKRKKLQLELKFNQQQIFEKTKRIEKIEKERRKRKTELDLFAEQLNDLLRLISVAPSDAKLAYDNDYTLIIDHNKETIDTEDVNSNIRRLTSVDLKQSLKPHLKRIYKLLLEEKATSETEITRLQSYLEDLISRQKKLEKERGKAQQRLDNLKNLNEAKNKMFETEREKVNAEIFKKKMTAFKDPVAPTSLFELTGKYNKMIESEKELILKHKNEKECKKNEVMTAIEKFLAYRSLRVDEFKQLSELTEKISIMFPGK